MRSEPWDTTSSVVEVSSRVDVDGAEVPVSDLSISRVIPSNLPAQVSGRGGFQASSGSVTVSSSEVVTDKSPTPWGSSTPNPLAPVRAYAKSGNYEVPVFDGLVDKTSGRASDQGTDVKLVDTSDRLSRQVSIRPMCRMMPAPTTDGTTNHLHSDLFSTYLVDKVLRDCGYYATPPKIRDCVMSAPMMGSAWPEVGRLTYAGRGASWKESPYWATTPWGMSASQLRADYTPVFSRPWAVDGRLTRPMEIVVCAGSTLVSSGRIYAEWPSGGRLSVAVTSSRSVLVQAMFPSSMGSWQTVLTATTATLGRWRNVTVRFSPIGGGKMKVELRTNNKGQASISGPSIPYGVEIQSMSNIRVDLDQSNLGGFQVGFPSQSVSFEAAAHKPTAVLTPPSPTMPLDGTPAIMNEKAIDLLSRWSEAECAAMWIDEDGVFQWRNRSRFVSGNPVATFTSSNDLLDLDWSHEIQGASAKAMLKYKRVGVKRSKTTRIPVWQSSGQTMEPGDNLEEFVTTPDDEAWINVDSSLSLFQAPSSKTSFNQGRGSWAGYVAYDKNGDEHGNTEYVGYDAQLQPMGWKAWKLTQTWDGHVPTGVDHIKLSTRDGGTALKPQWQGFNLPVLRAQAQLTFTDDYLGATSGGSPDAPDLDHDVGWWIQHDTALRSLAFWLAQQTSRPLPVVDGVEILPDPRIQLGDKINVWDSHRTGLRITGVVTGIDHRMSSGSYSMSLKLLVTDIHATQPTLADYDSVFSGASLSVRDELWMSSTLAEFDSDPLKR